MKWSHARTEDSGEEGRGLSKRLVRTNERGIEASFNMQASEGEKEGALPNNVRQPARKERAAKY